jgi:hypothetical protein
MEGSPNKTFLPSIQLLDPSLDGPLEDGFRDRFVETLRSLYAIADEADREAVGSAIELHYAASLLFATDPNAGYALAVAGIETLSQRFGDAPADWDAWPEAPRFDSLFAELELTAKQVGRLRREVLSDRHLRLQQTFARYVVEHLSDDFFAGEVSTWAPGLTMTAKHSEFTHMTPGPPIPIAHLVPPDRAVLRRRLLASYQARSSYVHEGKGHDAFAASASQMVGQAARPTDRIEFLGLRLILRSLALAELEGRSDLTTRPLPEILTITTQEPRGQSGEGG